MHASRRLACLACLALCGLLAAAARAEDIRIVAPYAGILTDTQNDSGFGELKDSGLLTGLYFQWIKPDAYQWNAFAYYAPDVNYTKTVGGHFIFDCYLGPDWHGKFVLGAGIEALRLDMDAGDAFPPFDENRMTQTFLIPYLRAGKYFKASVGPAELSLLPWAGIEPQWAWGDLKMSMPFPPMTIKQSLDDSTFYGIAGVNLKANLFHFIDLEGKYQAAFNKSDYLNSVQAVAFLYLSRSWGLSYRYQYMETTQGSDGYHYFGVAYVF
jgi:hypothetical protein